MTLKDLVSKFQRALNTEGAAVSVDGVMKDGGQTLTAADRYDIDFIVTPKEVLTPVVSVSGDKPDYILELERRLGEKEIAGAKDNPWIVSLFKATGIWDYIQKLSGNRDEVAWCKALVNWVLALYGYDISKSPSALATDSARIGTPCEPQKYALAVWKHLKGSLAGHFHTNFLHEEILDASGTLIGWSCIGGNQGNQVSIGKYLLADHKLASTTMPQKTGEPSLPVLPVLAPANPVRDVSSNLFKKGSAAWYESAYRIIQFDLGFEKTIAAAAKRVLTGKSRYQAIEKQTGVPWWVIGVNHNMECSCDFKGVLHNGERIIGTGRKTVLVPKGRGPFSTWEESALDAISIEPQYKQTGWSIGNALHVLELFNGAGYLNHHPEENSPYLWSQTNINDGHGKYVADGKYSSTADSNGQTGAAAIIKQLELWGELRV